MTLKLGDRLANVLASGKEPNTQGYSCGIDGLPRVRRNEIYQILGGTGSGKSYSAVLNFGLEPLMDFLNVRTDKDIFHWNLYSFEMDEDEVVARLGAYLYAKKTRTLLPAAVIEGLLDEKISDKAYDWLISNAVPLLNELSPYITVFGKKSAKEIEALTIDFYAKHGEFVLDKDTIIGYKTDKRILLLSTVDHVALAKRESTSKKSAIDDLASVAVDTKVMFKSTWIFVQQLNRQEGDIAKLKFEINPTPKLSEAKDSGDISDAATIILAIFSPARFEIENYFGFPIKGGLGDRGRWFFILKGRKQSVGKVACCFYGESGVFIKLPSTPEHLSLADYASMRKGTYYN